MNIITFSHNNTQQGTIVVNRQIVLQNDVSETPNGIEQPSDHRIGVYGFLLPVIHAVLFKSLFPLRGLITGDLVRCVSAPLFRSSIGIVRVVHVRGGVGNKSFFTYVGTLRIKKYEKTACCSHRQLGIKSEICKAFKWACSMYGALDAIRFS